MSAPGSPRSQMAEAANTPAVLEHLRRSRLLDRVLSAGASKPEAAKLLSADNWKKPARAGLSKSQSVGPTASSKRGSSVTLLGSSGLAKTLHAGQRDDAVAASATDTQQEAVHASVFPDWLRAREDFKEIEEEPAHVVVFRRDNVETALREELEIEPRGHPKYFQGPQRSLNLRRNAFLYTNVSTVRTNADDDDIALHAAAHRWTSVAPRDKAAVKASTSVGGTLKRVASKPALKKVASRSSGGDEGEEEEMNERDRILLPLEV